MPTYLSNFHICHLELLLTNEIKEEREGWTDPMRLTQIVCRRGDPVLLSDLRKVSAAAARSIVVLAKYDIPPDLSDARAVRCVLALRGKRANGERA